MMPDRENSQTEQSVRQLLFGKYEIGRMLGHGTFAKVYYAKDLRSNESVAIKVINKDQVRKEHLMEQIKREISVMRLVRHPNIVELKEVMATKTKIFFVMEYVRGGELFAKITKGKMKEDIARKYFQQLISAVDYCHSRGVSHRDLKPENLLLDDDENLKISDFGLSALPEQYWQDGLLHTQCGTPAYVAPEVLRKKGYDGAKADIWSCGVILFVLLSGYLPFQDENIIRMYRKMFKGEFKYSPWFPPDAKRLNSRLLVVDPEKRITLPGIMEDIWFKRGFQRSASFRNRVADEEVDQKLVKKVENFSMGAPPSLNAFELISSMSTGFDLSNLFEIKKKDTMFTSKSSPSSIIAALEGVGKGSSLSVERMDEFKVKMEATEDGRKGKLLLKAEVFEIAPQVALVEISKSAGDTLEYAKLCKDEIRPALKDIVWTWKGN